MLFAVLCNDKPDHLDLRLKTRATHLEYLKSLGEHLKFAGPFLDGQGKPCGTLMVLMASDETIARKLAENDPYNQIGLFADTEIRPWNWTVNNPDLD